MNAFKSKLLSRGKTAGESAEYLIITHLYEISIRELASYTFLRKRQAEGIAAEKARGVKFGRPLIPLPENFRTAHAAWRAKKLTLRQAADACHMKVGTFYDKAVKLEKAP